MMVCQVPVGREASALSASQEEQPDETEKDEHGSTGLRNQDGVVAEIRDCEVVEPTDHDHVKGVGVGRGGEQPRAAVAVDVEADAANQEAEAEKVNGDVRDDGRVRL